LSPFAGEIVIFNESLRSRWESYVQEHKSATYFHDIRWKKVLELALRYETSYLVAISGDLIVGVMPLAIVRSKLFGVTAVSLPFCSYCGPIADDDQITEKLISKAAEVAQAKGAKYLASQFHPGNSSQP
jgi:hypothetical protein